MDSISHNPVQYTWWCKSFIHPQIFRPVQCRISRCLNHKLQMAIILACHLAGGFGHPKRAPIFPAFQQHVPGKLPLGCLGDDEITLRDNHLAFQRITMRPRILVNVREIDMSTTLGCKLDLRRKTRMVVNPHRFGASRPSLGGVFSLEGTGYN